MRAAALSGRPGCVYNVGGGERVALNEVLRLIEDVTGTTAPNPAPGAPEGRHERHRSPTPTAARARPRVPIQRRTRRGPRAASGTGSGGRREARPRRRPGARRARCPACAGKQLDMRSLASASDEVVWEAGQKAIGKKDWEAARQYYKRIVDAFPQSEHQPDARIALADTLLRGGRHGQLHPGRLGVPGVPDALPEHPARDYAQFRAGESLLQAEEHVRSRPDRDPEGARGVRAAARHLPAVARTSSRPAPGSTSAARRSPGRTTRSGTSTSGRARPGARPSRATRRSSTTTPTTSSSTRCCSALAECLAASPAATPRPAPSWQRLGAGVPARAPSCPRRTSSRRDFPRLRPGCGPRGGPCQRLLRPHRPPKTPPATPPPHRPLTSSFTLRMSTKTS